MTLFALSCFTFMFFIPLGVDLFYFNFLETVAIQNDNSEQLFSLVFYSMIIMIPCMMIGYLGLVGSCYTMKKIVWQEGVIVSHDFFMGIKENWSHALIDGLLFGIALFGFVVGSSYLYIYAPIHAMAKGIGIGGLVLILLLFGMISILDLVQSVYYSNNYLRTFKNSFSFLGLLNWKILVIYLLTSGVVIGLSMVNMITLAIGLFLFAILNSVVIALYTLISHSAFDKYINSTHYPEYVGKGLYKDINNSENSIKDNSDSPKEAN